MEIHHKTTDSNVNASASHSVFDTESSHDNAGFTPRNAARTRFMFPSRCRSQQLRFVGSIGILSVLALLHSLM
jgi:hypothetical protein